MMIKVSTGAYFFENTINVECNVKTQYKYLSQ